MVVASSVEKYTRNTPISQCSFMLCVVDQDLSHMGDDEPYDYKFVKWMIKEKVS